MRHQCKTNYISKPNLCCIVNVLLFFWTYYNIINAEHIFIPHQLYRTLKTLKTIKIADMLNNSSWPDCLILVVSSKTVFINLCLFLKKTNQHKSYQNANLTLTISNSSANVCLCTSHGEMPTWFIRLEKYQ